MTKNNHLRSLKAVEFGSSVHVWLDSRTSFLCSNDFTNNIELGQRSVYIDVSQIEHTMVRMKKIPDHMRTVNTLLADCNRNFVIGLDTYILNSFSYFGPI